MSEHEQGSPLQDIVKRCWEDAAFRERLATDPAATLRAEGVEVPEGVTVRVVVESETERALVIPPPPDTRLADEELSGIHGGWFFPTDCPPQDFNGPLDPE